MGTEWGFKSSILQDILTKLNLYQCDIHVNCQEISLCQYSILNTRNYTVFHVYTLFFMITMIQVGLGIVRLSFLWRDPVDAANASKRNI